MINDMWLMKRIINTNNTEHIDCGAPYLIARTKCVENNLGPGISIDIDIKLLGMILASKNPSKYVRCYETGHIPMLELFGENSYFPSEGFSYAVENGFKIYFKKDVRNMFSDQIQIHFVVTDDEFIIEYLIAKGYKEEGKDE